MKYRNKCAYCSRKADRRWRGQYLCEDCQKFMRRKKIVGFMGKERLVMSMPLTGMPDKFLRIYRDIPVYFK